MRDHAPVRDEGRALGPALVVDLGAVGVTVQCTPSTALALRSGEHVELTTTMVVREDGWTLYGFADPDERTVFEQVQTVTGIGPRIALAVLGFNLLGDGLRDHFDPRLEDRR